MSHDKEDTPDMRNNVITSGHNYRLISLSTRLPYKPLLDSGLYQIIQRQENQRPYYVYD